MKLSKELRERLMPVVSKLQPAARVVERVAGLAVHVRNPNPLTLLSLGATGISALANEWGNPGTPPSSFDLLVSRGQVVKAIEDAGGKVVVHRYHDNSEDIECTVHGAQFRVGSRGQLIGTIDAALREWLRQAVDRVLPACIEVRRKIEREDVQHESVPVSLTSHSNAQATAIMKATLPLLEGGRVILLDGKPGVGKTTMAQIIAREAQLGRVVMLENTIVGNVVDYSHAVASGPPQPNGEFRDGLALLSPGVVIVDDVDKVSIHLAKLEALKAAAKLVILTANNGQYDDVLDGALMRAGRVDEVFTIEPAELARVAPFDALTDDEWAEVSQWPIAYVNEVRKRLSNRAGDPRLDDLRARLTRKTRSGDVLR